MEKETLSNYPGTLNSDERNDYLRHIISIAKTKYFVTPEQFRRNISDVMPRGTFNSFMVGHKNLRRALESLEGQLNNDFSWLVKQEVPEYGTDEFYAYISAPKSTDFSPMGTKQIQAEDLRKFDRGKRNTFLRLILRYLNSEWGVTIAYLTDKAEIGRTTASNFSRGIRDLSEENLIKLETTVTNLYWALLQDKFPLFNTPEFEQYLQSI